MSQIPPSGRIESLQSYYDFHATVDVLRLDLIHPVVSGNKWFKLDKYLTEAVQQQKIILTFGGAYSNHIVATAAAAKSNGLKSIGVIRGEEPAIFSPTLMQAREYGMLLYFTTREAYKRKKIPELVYAKHSPNSVYIIPEGGYGEMGAEGAADMIRQNHTSAYTHFLIAAGTGTSIAGLQLAALENQRVIGVSALKNNYSLTEEINQLLPAAKHSRFELLQHYHFGGYAKYTIELLRFMNAFYEKTGIPTDFVYTAKAFYAAFDLLQKGYFKESDKLLLIHSGGLQGNASLPKGTLIFG